MFIRMHQKSRLLKSHRLRRPLSCEIFYKIFSRIVTEISLKTLGGGKIWFLKLGSPREHSEQVNFRPLIFCWTPNASPKGVL